MSGIGDIRENEPQLIYTGREKSNTWQVVENSFLDKDDPTRIVLFSYSDYQKQVEQKVTATKVGMYRRRSIDMEVSVASMNFNLELRKEDYASIKSVEKYIHPYKEVMLDEDHMGIAINLLSPPDRSNEKLLSMSSNVSQYFVDDSGRSLKIKDSFFAFVSGVRDSVLYAPLKELNRPTNSWQFKVSNYLIARTFLPGEYVELDFKFYYSDSPLGNPEYVENYQGMWNWANMNSAKDLTVKVRSINDFYIVDTTDDYFQKDRNDYYYTSTKIEGSDLEKVRIHGVTVGTSASTINASSRLTQVLELNNGVYSVRYDPVQRDSSLTTLAQKRKAAILSYDKYPVPRVAPSIPDVTGEKNEAKTKEADYHKLKYSFIETIADNSTLNRDNSLTLESVLPERYTFDVRHFSTLSFSTTEKWIDQDVNIAQQFPDPSDFLSEITVDAANTSYSGQDMKKLLDISVLAVDTPSSAKTETEAGFKAGGGIDPETPGNGEEDPNPPPKIENPDIPPVIGGVRL